jgi:hypothetical protein
VKKARILSTIFSITSILLISWSLVVLAGVTGAFSSNEHSWIADNPRLQGVTKNDNYYNVSLLFSNQAYNQTLNNILINPNSQEKVIGLTAYLNGTAVDSTEPISYTLQQGNSLQVNLVFPCTNFASGTSINIHVIGDTFGCSGFVVLP